MLLLGVKNFATQDVGINGIINLGSVYRKYCKRVNGTTTFSFNGNSVSLNQKGMYHITATAVVSAPAAGDVIIQLLENGTALSGALATETITTATTELRTLVIDYFILVDSSCLLGVETNESRTISLANTGVASTVTNVVFNVEKVL